MIEPAALSRLALFADLSPPELAAVAQVMDEASFSRDTLALRAGVTGNAFYVITEGEAVVLIDGTARANLFPGDYFGEVGIFTGEVTGADVAALSEELRCAALPGSELRRLLLDYPQIGVRMLEVGARRLRAANLWAG